MCKLRPRPFGPLESRVQGHGCSLLSPVLGPNRCLVLLGFQWWFILDQLVNLIVKIPQCTQIPILKNIIVYTSLHLCDKQCILRLNRQKGLMAISEI